MDRSFIAHNAVERERLAIIVARLGDADLARPLDAGWTVAATLAHVAFWDRFVQIRWEQALGEGGTVPPLDDRVLDLINAAGLEQWRAIPGRDAARMAVDAAETLDRLLERLPSQAVRAAQERGQRRLLDRSAHRREHLDEIEGVLPGLS